MDSEIEEAVIFKDLMNSITLTEEEDCRMWDERNTKYTANLGIKKFSDIRRERNQLGRVNFPVDKMWKLDTIPPNVVLYKDAVVWKSFNGGCFTKMGDTVGESMRVLSVINENN